MKIKRLGMRCSGPSRSPVRVVAAATALGILACAVSAHADTSAQVSAEGVSGSYDSQPGVEVMTAPLTASGTCTGTAGAMGQVSASGGFCSLTTSATSAPPGFPGCSASVANAIAGGDATVTFRLISATVPVGTATVVTVCYRLLSATGIAGGTSGSFNNSVSAGQSASLCATGGSTGQVCLSGMDNRSQTYTNAPVVTTTGLYAAGGESGDVILENVLVGSTVNLSVSLHSQSITNINAPGSADAQAYQVMGFGLSCSDAGVSIVFDGTTDPAPGPASCDLSTVSSHVLADPGGLVSVAGPVASGPALAAAPNPFRDVAVIRLESGPRSGSVRLAVYDVRGRRMRILRATDASADEIRWDGRDDVGTRVPAGVYFVRGFVGSRRVAGRLVRVE